MRKYIFFLLAVSVCIGLGACSDSSSRLEIEYLPVRLEPGQTGSLHVGGVWEIKKTGTAAITMGQTVYFDGTGITDAKDNGATTNPTAYIEAGFAAADAKADAETILVKLRG